jgi:Protein of unknown function (DUF3300)
MKLGKPLLGSLCVAACLLTQACVEYIPENGYRAPAQEPPNPPPSMPQYADTQSTPPTPPATPPPPPPSAEQSSLDSLLAPIALYPDPLIAVILPASTRPSEISAAAAFMIQYGDPTQIDGQPWDPSVRGLAHYTTVLTWMADNMSWTQSLGAAFSASPTEVMASIQRLRSRALASGALAPSPQEQVLTEDDMIEIDPTMPGEIYVPTYDADAVFADGPYGGPPIEFGTAYPSGIWLSYSVDWRSRAVWVAGPGAQRGPGGWYNPRYHGGHAPADARAWHPPAGRPQGLPAGGNPAPRPRPMSSPAVRGPNASSTQQRGTPPAVRPAAGTVSPDRTPPSEAPRASAPPAHPEPAHSAPAHPGPAHDKAPAPAAAQATKDHDQVR